MFHPLIPQSERTRVKNDTEWFIRQAELRALVPNRQRPQRMMAIRRAVSRLWPQPLARQQAGQRSARATADKRSTAELEAMA